LIQLNRQLIRLWNLILHFINITYHQQEVVYENAGNGLMRKRTVRKRPGTVGIASAIKYRYGINVVPHIICGGFSKEDTENALIDLQFLGVNNLLLIRGDPEPGTRVFKPEPNGNEHALDLIEQVTKLNNGLYLDEELEKHSVDELLYWCCRLS